MFNIYKLTRGERIAARRLGVSASDVHRCGVNSVGILYGLYNEYYLTEITVNGYTMPEIYRLLLRKLINQVGIVEE